MNSPAHQLAVSRACAVRRGFALQCFHLQTCIVVILMLGIEYIVYTNFRSHNSYQLGVILTHVVCPL